MPMTMNDLCDEILKTCSWEVQLEPNVSLQKIHEASGEKPYKVEAALYFLCHADPPYLTKVRDDKYVLTPAGESFWKRGGFAGEKERSNKEEAIKQKDLELARLASQTAIDTGRSTKRTSWGSLIVAICAALILLANLIVNIYAITNTRQNSPLSQPQSKQDSLHMPSTSNTLPDQPNQVHP